MAEWAAAAVAVQVDSEVVVVVLGVVVLEVGASLAVEDSIAVAAWQIAD